MKTIHRSVSARMFAMIALVLTALAITACGGGGGGTTTAGGTTPVGTPTLPVITTCPTGQTLTTALACQTIPVLTITSVSPLSVTSTIAIKSNTALSGVTSVSVAGNGTTYPGNASLSADKLSISIVPSATLPYATTLTVTVKANANGVEGTVTGTLVTEAAVTCKEPAQLNSLSKCISPPAATGYKWNAVMKAWVADIGTLVVGANTLPATCVNVGDDCWKASVADGTIKFVESGVVMTGQNTRPIVWAFYVVGAGGGPSFTGFYNEKALFSDIEASAASSNPFIGNGSANIVASEIKGSANGAKITVPSQGCFERVWSNGGFGTISIPCPI